MIKPNGCPQCKLTRCAARETCEARGSHKVHQQGGGMCRGIVDLSQLRLRQAPVSRPDAISSMSPQK